MNLRLTGLGISVYTWVVRMALAEKRLNHQFIEVNPFLEKADPKLDALTPFKRVPVLSHDDFVLYETAAILRYLDSVFPDPPLVPDDARAAARMQQIIGIIDFYGYWPMIRQVFAERVIGPTQGARPDKARMGRGVKSAVRTFSALEAIAAEGLQLSSADISLADIHLAPMMGYFVMTPEGKMLLDQYPHLTHWWAFISQRESYLRTRPDLKRLGI